MATTTEEDHMTDRHINEHLNRSERASLYLRRRQDAIVDRQKHRGYRIILWSGAVIALAPLFWAGVR
jgi:hypothetical protein